MNRNMKTLVATGSLVAGLLLLLWGLVIVLAAILITA